MQNWAKVKDSLELLKSRLSRLKRAFIALIAFQNAINAQNSQNASLRFGKHRFSRQTRVCRVLRFWESRFKRAGRDKIDPDLFSNAIVAHLRFCDFDTIAFPVSLRYYRF